MNELIKQIHHKLFLLGRLSQKTRRLFRNPVIDGALEEEEDGAEQSLSSRYL